MNSLLRLCLTAGLLWLGLTLPQYVIAQSTTLAGNAVLNGLVTDQKTREPLIGATIFVPSLQKGAATDTLGRFRLPGLPMGPLSVEVRLVGYKTLTRRVQLSADSTRFDFMLATEATQLNEVVVTGLTTGSTVKESPIPIMTYSKMQWLQTASTNLVDAVVKLPGMSQISTGVGLSKPVIRGLGFNRVITVHDGVRQEDNQWGEEHALQIDEYSIDRYEIIKGAGSLLYGSDGLGGVMSLISARPPQPGVTQGQIMTNYQSNNGMLGLSAMMETTGQKGVYARLRVSGKSAGNYRNRFDGRVYGSAYREMDVNGAVGISRKWGYSQLNFSNWHQDINIVTGERDRTGRFVKLVRVNETTEDVAPVSDAELRSRAINPANYQNLNHTKLSWNTFARIGRGNLSAVVSYSQNRRQEFASTLTPGQPALYFFLQNVYYDLKYFMEARNGWEFTVGTSGLWQKNQNWGLEVLYPGYGSLDNGAVAFFQKKTDRLTVNGGVRVDVRRMQINPLYVDESGAFTETNGTNRAVRFAGLDKTYANPTASLGASYAVTPKLTVKANLARGFRAPSTPELSANGEHAGTFRYEIGNPNLKSETSFQSDLGVVYETPELSITASLFRNGIQNYTYSEKVLNRLGQDSIVDPARPILTYRYVQGNAVLYGAEAQLVYNPAGAKWLHLSGTYSLVRSRNLSAQGDSARYLPFLPPPRTIVQAKLTRTELGRALRNAYAQTEVEYNQAQNQALLAFGTETPTPAFTLWNIGAGADVVGKDGQTRFSVYVSINNLLDRAYQSHQNRLKYFGENPATGRLGVYNMGRNASIKVVVPLRF
ncbi:TonB-dependent receptor [Rudanella paleaurantiibacter]|uniref:TonB-dependent receptor n=1 Tax=Rudanella paleaurantiibacter TaxID=2614655 RepID=A0A7J5U227_9BACT|nr:TonB-dependent receptor [Rudanella paleaurantiibacter]KAB7731827.1 TonB-dependent receptor [Rudanella paleaurantiibacter]